MRRAVGLVALLCALHGGRVDAFTIRAPTARTRGWLQASAVPEEPPGGGRDWASKVQRRSASRLNKGKPRGEEPVKKEAKKEPPQLSKDGFFRGTVGIGTYAWGDPRRGFIDEYPSDAMQRSQLMCGSYTEADIEEAFAYLEGEGLFFFDARELYPCEGLLGGLIRNWRKRQLARDDGKEMRPWVATTYQARLFGSGLFDVRGGRGKLLRALERSLEQLQATRVNLLQVTRPNALYLGGEKSLFEALGRAKAMRLVEHVGVIGYTGEQLERACTTAKGFGIDLKSNSVELSLANPAPLLDGTLDACQRNDVLVFANRPLGGGLLGAYTMMDPTGGNSCKPRFSFKELEPLYPVHKALREVAKKYSEKLGKRVSTAQVSVNWVRAKGAVPLVGVNRAAHAKELVESTKWDLEQPEVEELERVAVEAFKKRNRLQEAVRRVRG